MRGSLEFALLAYLAVLRGLTFSLWADVIHTQKLLQVLIGGMSKQDMVVELGIRFRYIQDIVRCIRSWNLTLVQIANSWKSADNFLSQAD